MLVFAFVATLIGGLATLGYRERQATTLDAGLTQARQHALSGLHEAIAVLQESLGPDPALSVPAALREPLAGDSGWVWTRRADQTGEPGRWLVAGPAEPADIDPDDAVRWVRLRDRGPERDAVFAPRKRVPGRDPAYPTGHYSWWIDDLATRASLGYRPPLGSTPTAYAEETPWQTIPATSLGLTLPPPAILAATSEWLDFAAWPGLDADTARRLSNVLTWRSLGVWSRPGAHGLRANLSDPDYRNAWIDDAAAEFLQGIPTITGNRHPLAPDARYRPWLTEFKLSVGIFHTHQSSVGNHLHRLRFHVEAEFWNPYPRRLQYPRDDRRDVESWFGETYGWGRGYYLLVEGAPAVSIENLDTGEGFSADLAEFPYFPGLDQRVANPGYKRVLNSWFEFARGRLISDDGQSGVLAPGEVYQTIEPHDERHEEGLARTLSARPWLWSMRDPGNGIAWLSREHDVRITVAPAALGLRLVPFVRPLAEDEDPRAYPTWDQPVLHLTNIPFDGFSVILKGHEYSRRISTDYRLEDYLFAWYFRQRDDPASLQALRPYLVGRGETLDFRDDAVAALFAVESNPRAALHLGNAFSALDRFRDGLPRSHQKPWWSREAYADIRFTDVPAHPLGSVGALRFWPLTAPHEPPLGAPAARAVNALFDELFFAADGGDPARAHPRYEAIPGSAPGALNLRGPDAAAYGWCEGAFNLNSVEPEAWATVLRHALSAWTREGHSGPVDLQRAVFTLPYGAAYSDALLPDGAAPDDERWWRQGARELTVDGLAALADAVAAANQAHSPAPGGFATIAAWLEAGVLDDAINSSGLNAGVPPGSPAMIQQRDLAAMLAPFLTTRGDTFLVRAYGDIAGDPNEPLPGRIWCEATVQRLPAFFDATDPPTTAWDDLSETNRALGRRFVITGFRWLRESDL